MISSTRLLLENFLGLMREEGELDIFLPLLLSGMGHEIVFRAHKGVRQHGVDFASTGPGDNRRKTLHLWLVKCGQIGRSEWNGGNQAVRQSIEDVETYLRSHRLPQHQRLPVNLVVITNGDFMPHITETVAAFLESWGLRNNSSTQLVNGSLLAAWTEKYLLDENVLPPDARALFRRTLANISMPELSIDAGRKLIDQLMSQADVPARSENALRKQRLAALRAVRTSITVLQHWGEAEGNLTAAYRLAEFAVLRVWSQYHNELIAQNKEIITEFAEVLIQLVHCATAYHNKMRPFYQVEAAFASQLADSLLVSDRVFTELGRLGLIGVICGFMASEDPATGLDAYFQDYLHSVETLLRSHTISSSPCWDHHALSIHTALILLTVGGKYDTAKAWVERLAIRLHHVAGNRTHLPLTCSFEDALAIRQGVEELSPEFINTSTIIPVLLLWTAALKMDAAYRFISDRVVPRMSDTSLNFWSSDTGFDDLVAFPSRLRSHGVGEVLQSTHVLPEKFLQAMSQPLQGVEPISQTHWFQLRAAYIPLLAGLHWNLQAPREMLVQHALAAVIALPAEPALSIDKI